MLHVKIISQFPSFGARLTNHVCDISFVNKLSQHTHPMAANYSAVTLGRWRIDSVKLNFEITSEMIQDSIKRIF